MPVYEFQGRRLRRPEGEDDLEHGDTYEADEDDPIITAFGDLFVESDEGDDSSEESDDNASDDIDELLSGTVEEVEEALSTGEYDDRLDDIAERADRLGVEEAVDDRRE